MSTREGRTLALFFNGRKHAGENLGEVLAHRAEGLSPPIQMTSGCQDQSITSDTTGTSFTCEATSAGGRPPRA